MLFGVCGGLAAYLDLDVTLVRVVFVVLALAGGSGVLIYLAAALLIPDEREVSVERVPPMPDEPGAEAGAGASLPEETAVTEEMAVTQEPGATGETSLEEGRAVTEEMPPPLPPPMPPSPPETVDKETTASRRRNVFGIVLIILGVLFLLGQYIDLWRWAWPIALIVLGLFLLFWERRA
jgi:phage shock protein C